MSLQLPPRSYYTQTSLFRARNALCVPHPSRITMREGRRLFAITQLLELPLFIALSTLCARLLEHRFVSSFAPTMQCTPHVYCTCSLLYYSFLSHQLFTRGFAYSSPGASLDEPSTLRLSHKENMKKPNHTENSVRFSPRSPRRPSGGRQSRAASGRRWAVVRRRRNRTRTRGAKTRPTSTSMSA